jgi:hypothetical protein
MNRVSNQGIKMYTPQAGAIRKPERPLQKAKVWCTNQNYSRSLNSSAGQTGQNASCDCRIACQILLYCVQSMSEMLMIEPQKWQTLDGQAMLVLQGGIQAQSSQHADAQYHKLTLLHAHYGRHTVPQQHKVTLLQLKGRYRDNSEQTLAQLRPGSHPHFMSAVKSPGLIHATRCASWKAPQGVVQTLTLRFKGCLWTASHLTDAARTGTAFPSTRGQSRGLKLGWQIKLKALG